MKKVILSLVVLTACLAVLPAVSASGSKDIFVKRLKICSTYSYTYKTVGGVDLKRTITGVQPGVGLVCKFEQELSKTKKIKCDFPVNSLNSIADSFKNGNENQLLTDYVDSKVCEIKE